MNEEPSLPDDFAVTSASTSVSASAISIATNNHFITSPFSTGSLTITSSAQSLLTWNGTLAPDLNTLATIGTDGSLVAVPIGGKLYDGTTAAGRRAFLPWSDTIIDLTLLTDNGYNLLSRALAWGGGVVGYWKLNETSGTTAADSSVNSLTGTLQNSPPWTSDCSQSGLQFNGTSQYVSVAHSSPLSITKALTLMAWVKSSNLTGWHAVVNKGTTGSNYYLSTKNDQVSFGFYNGGWSEFTTTTASLKPDTWYHLAVTFDDSTDQVRIYVNGVAVLSTTTTASPVANTQNLLIGSNEANEYWSGMLRDVRIFNHALGSSEIAKLAGMPGQWTFSEGSGTTAADSSPNANNATLSGGATWTTDCSGNNNALLTNGAGGIAQTNSAFTPPSVGTVTFWMRGSGPVTTRGRLCGVSGDWEIRQEPGGTLSFDLGGSPFVGNEPFSTLDPVDTNGKWYHIAAVFDDSDNSYSVYIDGKLRTSGISPVDLVPQAAGILSFGTRTGSTEYWNGALRDFRVYNRKLCATEIATLYGLVGHWKFDDASGTTAVDSSGFGYTGTLTGCTWTTGKISGGLKFNQTTTDMVTVSNAPNLSLPHTMTLAAWIKPSNSNPSGCIFNKGVFSYLCNYYLGTSGGNLIFSFQDGSAAWQDRITTGVTMNAGTWYHVAATFDDATDVLHLYVNGVDKLTTTISAALVTNADALTIGNNTSSALFPCSIDDARIYSRVLCPTEIQALYTAGGAFGGVKVTKWYEIQ